MKNSKIHSLLEQPPTIPVFILVFLGFSVSYIFFFIHPIFINVGQVMQIPKYLPVGRQIGEDLKETIDFSNTWLVDHLYVDNKPPLVILLYASLRFMPFTSAYKIITVINILCYLMIALVFPLIISKKRQISPLLTLLFVTGLFSYGFQFELERGQFNLLAIFLCFLAIWIYHYKNKYRYLSYILFAISVQLKLYPFIFVVMVVSDWQDWKNNIRRILLLLISNIVLLFVLGPKAFTDFVTFVSSQSKDPRISSILNHSIFSFVTFAAKVITAYGGSWANNYTWLTQILLFVIVFICIFLVLFQAYRQKQKGINPFLLLVCTVGALLIPAMSNDYTLSVLTGPVAMFLLETDFWKTIKGTRIRTFVSLLLFIFSVAYSSTLFSYTNKPALLQKLLQNNFPALFVMLLIVTFFSLLSKTRVDEKLPDL